MPITSNRTQAPRDRRRVGIVQNVIARIRTRHAPAAMRGVQAEPTDCSESQFVSTGTGTGTCDGPCTLVEISVNPALNILGQMSHLWILGPALDGGRRFAEPTKLHAVEVREFGLELAESCVKILKPERRIRDVPLAKVRAKLCGICCERTRSVSDHECPWILPGRPRSRTDPFDLSTALS